MTGRKFAWLRGAAIRNQMVKGKTAEKSLSILSLLKAVTAKYQVPVFKLLMTWLVSVALLMVITVFIEDALLP